MDQANASLENLAIENVVLIPEFSSDITEYTAEVESDIETLNILAIPQIEGATVNIEKPEILNFGENIITITVLAKDGITQKNYTVNVNRKEAKQEEVVEENIEPEKRQKDYIFLAIILISITGIIVALIRKYIKETKI